MGNWEELSVKYMWMTRGENCKICDAMAGRVYTYDTWIAASILPGFHLHCNCYLKKVAETVPVSDMDIFGSDIDIMLDNHYFLGLNISPDWVPYNRYMTRNIVSVAKETGMSISEIMKSYSTLTKEGGVFYKSLIKTWNQFFQWRVFRTLKVYQGAEDNISSSLSPSAETPTAYTPTQTYQSRSKLGH